MQKRKTELSRNTNETQISIKLDVDGTGKQNITTGNGMMDHLLAQLSRHSLIDMDIIAKGDIQTGWHHTIEDLGIILGKALNEALGDHKGINRMGHAFVPLDESLAFTAVDFSGRGYSVLDIKISDSDLGGLPADMIRHFLESFAREGKFNLHVKLISGQNNHHIAESIFKSLAKSIRFALTTDERQKDTIPSTKGTISD
ncbi:MAG: imidazoleglycerol-phosphate dehydratase [Chloroflexi bacterium]|nr:imidazoleglycerol-phosphate dehydratase [Chloroflexota bacterium]MCH2305022.1 imidazoleglycerol-phosphate dehydratase HisB [SAR202 cluster bacterium]